MIVKNLFLKTINLVLAGILTMMGFANCTKYGPDEYGVPNTDYTTKGSVVDKVTGKPVEGILVGYNIGMTMYGTLPTNYNQKMHVLTDSKGEFTITVNMFSMEEQQKWPVHIEDVDGEKNGLFESENVEVDFSNATRTKKPKSWYRGEYTVDNVHIKLNQAENQ